MIATLILYEKEIQTNSFFLHGATQTGQTQKGDTNKIFFLTWRST